ncbi:MAG: CRISPR-associated endonuclease Cas2, partial [Bacillota bacterium]
MQRYILVSYDISDQKRWSKVYKTMKGFGEHIQYSVFVCQLSDLQKAKLKVKLESFINHNEDQVMLVDLGPAGQKL